MRRVIATLFLLIALSSGAVALADGGRVSFQARLSDSMPEMTFQAEVVGEQIRRDSFNREYIVRLSICESDNPERFIQDLYFTTENALAEDTFNFADINFDGYLDLDSLYYAAVSNEVKTFFLWEPAQGKFVPAALYGQWLSRYAVYPEKRLILSYIHETALTGDYELYTWQDGLLLLLRRSRWINAEDDPYMIDEILTDYTQDVPGGVELFRERYSVDRYTEAFSKERYELRMRLLWEGYGQPEDEIY